MARRRKTEERRLSEMRKLTTICRTCGSRHVFGQAQLLGMQDGGVDSLGALRRRSFCVLCHHAGDPDTNLRFIAEWASDPPGPTIRIVSVNQIKSAA